MPSYPRDRKASNAAIPPRRAETTCGSCREFVECHVEFVGLVDIWKCGFCGAEVRRVDWANDPDVIDLARLFAKAVVASKRKDVRGAADARRELSRRGFSVHHELGPKGGPR